jgi:hypothetical protein
MIVLLIDLGTPSLLIYLTMTLFILLTIYFIFRWIFSIDKQLNQNETIINLLRLLAKGQGFNDDEIYRPNKKVIT